MKLSRRRMNLKAFDQVQLFKGAQTRLCTMDKACYITTTYLQRRFEFKRREN